MVCNVCIAPTADPSLVDIDILYSATQPAVRGGGNPVCGADKRRRQRPEHKPTMEEIFIQLQLIPWGEEVTMSNVRV